MRRALEFFLAIVGSANAIFVVTAFAQFNLPNRESIFALFMAPGIYFLEILAVSLLAIISMWKNTDAWLQTLWAGIGALMGILILGMWTIGMPLLPTLITFSITAVSMSNRKNLSIKDGIRIGLIFFAIQIIFMLGIIWLGPIGLISD